MSGANLQHLLAMILYMAAVVGIGIYFAGRANKDAESYFLGGRSLGPWVTAFSAEASDMSGYLLMGLPGLAYWTGLADAGWTCIGLAIGTYLNFLIVSKRLRRYSIAVNAFTLPDFFSNRFHEKKKIIMTICSLIIIIFFSVYAAQCLSTCGKLFANLFGFSYGGMMIVAAVFVLAYTFLGGYLAESASDFMQGVVMVTVLVLILILSVVSAGGLNTVIENAKSIDGFFSMVRTATPSTTEVNVFGAGRPYGALSIASCLAWGLGYFGMPQVLLRFMGIRSEHELGRSRRVAIIWVVISMAAAVFIGVVGRSVAGLDYLSNNDAENIFIDAATSYLPPILAGFACAGVLAAAISSSLTVTTSSTYCWHRAKVRSPGFFTAMPSAMVDTLRSSVGPPAWRDRYMDAAPAAWTPTIRQSGFSCFTAKAMPPMRPPPPMGTTICSTSGSCSRISRPMVPWPAITSGSLKGWAKV